MQSSSKPSWSPTSLSRWVLIWVALLQSRLCLLQALSIPWPADSWPGTRSLTVATTEAIISLQIGSNFEGVCPPPFLSGTLLLTLQLGIYQLTGHEGLRNRGLRPLDLILKVQQQLSNDLAWHFLVSSIRRLPLTRPWRPAPTPFSPGAPSLWPLFQRMSSLCVTFLCTWHILGVVGQVL